MPCDTNLTKERFQNLDYTHQYVADLAWIITSPKLLSEIKLADDIQSPAFSTHSLNSNIWPEWNKRLEQINQSPEGLIDYIEQRQTKRVGFYYEALVSFLLKHFPYVELIAEHLQLQQQGKTLGEVDFIYKDEKSKKVIHLETAVKFYLGSPAWLCADTPYKHWLGPMVKDRLDIKTQHLINHQTRISQSPAFIEIAKEKQLAIPDTQEVLMQGYLFTHPDKPLEYPYTTEHQLNTENQKPFWIKEEEIGKHLNNEDSFLILTKPFWLSPFHDKASNTLLTRDELQGKIQSLNEEWNRPVLVSAFNKVSEQKNSLNLYQEANRCFIVPNNWAGIDPPPSETPESKKPSQP